MSDSDLMALLELLYEGPLENQPWCSFLHGLCEWLNLAGASITLWESDLEPISTFVLAVDECDRTDWETMERDYYQHHAQTDPVGAERVLPGEVRHATRAEMSPSYQEYCARLGIHHFGRACFSGKDDSRAWLEFFRRHPDQSFTADEEERLRSLLPHLSRSLRMHQRLMQYRVKEELYEQANLHVAVGMVILNGTGAVIHCNRAAQRIMEEVAILTLVNGRPTLTDRGKQHEFKRAIDQLIYCSAAQIESREGYSVALQHEGRLFGLLACDLHNPAYFKGRHTPHVALYMLEIGCELGLGGNSSDAAQLLSRLLGLTPQEARTALLMSDDLSIPEVSAALAVTEATARNYSKRIYQKLGLSRRSDLVKVVQRSLALLGPVTARGCARWCGSAQAGSWYKSAGPGHRRPAAVHTGGLPHRCQRR